MNLHIFTKKGEYLIEVFMDLGNFVCGSNWKISSLNLSKVTCLSERCPGVILPGLG